MTDNEIIKVFNNELKCVKRQFGSMCDNKRDCGKCDLALPDDVVISAYESVLNLINRQKAEIESLKQIIDEQDKEILKLQKRIIFWREDLNYQPEKIKSEAIKEFAERLKGYPIVENESKEIAYLFVEVRDIDNLVKEMTEVQK